MLVLTRLKTEGLNQRRMKQMKCHACSLVLSPWTLHSHAMSTHVPARDSFSCQPGCDFDALSLAALSQHLLLSRHDPHQVVLAHHSRPFLLFLARQLQSHSALDSSPDSSLPSSLPSRAASFMNESGAGDGESLESTRFSSQADDFDGPSLLSATAGPDLSEPILPRQEGELDRYL